MVKGTLDGTQSKIWRKNVFEQNQQKKMHKEIAEPDGYTFPKVTMTN